MKKLLMVLAMLFVTFLNIRVLFCEQGVNINTEFSVYDAIVGIKDHLFSPVSTSTNLDTNVVTCAETKMIAKNRYEQELDHAMNSFKGSRAWSEMGIQQLINLIDLDMKLVRMLIEGKPNTEITADIKQRDEMLRKSAPTIVQVYNRMMDVATYDQKLEPQSYKNKKGETMVRSGYLTAREKKRYLKNIEKSLRSMARNLAVEQDQMSMVSAMKHSKIVKSVMNSGAHKSINTAVDAQDVAVKNTRRMNRCGSKKMNRADKNTPQSAEAKELIKSCDMLKNALEKYVGR